MTHLKIIQIGDIHYPTATVPLVDKRDCGVGDPFVRAISALPIQNVIRKVIELCQKDAAVKGILLCGDLTSCGDIVGYKRCVEYLCRSLGKGAPEIWNQDSVHVVPGNHDIDRSLCDPRGEDLYCKFTPLEDVWRSRAFPVLTCRNVRQTTVSMDRCKALILSLNSCIGCGERRSMPLEIEKFHKLLPRFARRLGHEKAFRLQGEQLDTPAFVEAELSDVQRAIQALDRHTAPIVMAHHNILAQAVPRVDIYTEAINSGLVRSRLSSLNTTTIYCHGHIHADPVEVVTSGNAGDGRLIAVSAPEFTQGFNVVDLEFNTQDIPLGCTVRPFRLFRDGTVREETGRCIRIGLKRLKDAVSVCDDKTHVLMAQLQCGHYQRFADVVDSVRTTLRRKTKAETIARILGEAYWFDLVDILNREGDYRDWHIQRITP